MGLALLDQKAAEEALPRVVALMAPLLGWSEEEAGRELEEARRGLLALC